MAGITSKKKEVKPIHPVTPNPDLIHKSKAEFIEMRKQENARALKLKEYNAGLIEQDKSEGLNAKETETRVTKSEVKQPEAKQPEAKAKPRGRPKKIE